MANTNPQTLTHNDQNCKRCNSSDTEFLYDDYDHDENENVHVYDTYICNTCKQRFTIDNAHSKISNGYKRKK